MERLFVIVIHNEHVYNNACQEKVVGPLTEEEGKRTLANVKEAFNYGRRKADGHWEIDYNETYLGLDNASFKLDLAAEKWAELVPLETWEPFEPPKAKQTPTPSVAKLLAWFDSLPEQKQSDILFSTLNGTFLEKLNGYYAKEKTGLPCGDFEADISHLSK